MQEPFSIPTFHCYNGPNRVPKGVDIPEGGWRGVGFGWFGTMVLVFCVRLVRWSWFGAVVECEAMDAVPGAAHRIPGSVIGGDGNCGRECKGVGAREPRW